MTHFNSSCSWRESARPIIARVLTATRGQDESVIRKALREAYPFGMRENYPYKVWLDEIKRQRQPRQTEFVLDSVNVIAPLPGQLNLF